MSEGRLLRIRQRLLERLQPVDLELVDESHLHVGHAGAREGKGHYSVRIVSSAFAGLSVLKRHRLVYAALDTLMSSDIHALRIKALTPDEDQRNKTNSESRQH